MPQRRGGYPEGVVPKSPIPSPLRYVAQRGERIDLLVGLLGE